MRNIAACYSEHAIKVSDSYCSGISNQAYLSSKSNLSIQNAVTCIYKAKLSTQNHIFITVTWCNLIPQGFTITIVDESPSSHLKFNSNSWQIRKIKGTQHVQSSNSNIKFNWDLSHAKYESGPEPVNGFYISVWVNSELSLLIGEMEEEIELKNIAIYSLVSRSVHFSGSAFYSTKAQFCESGTCHDILIKCVADDRGLKNAELSVCIDKRSVIEVKRLQWNFRGNQAIFVDGLLVDMMWDVYDWFFNPTSGYGVFMFRPRSGLDSRLWLEEKNLGKKEQDRVLFSLLICAARKNS